MTELRRGQDCMGRKVMRYVRYDKLTQARARSESGGKGISRGANRPGPFAELCGDHGNTGASRAPFHAVEFATERFEQCVTGLRDAAANDHDFGIEEVDAGTDCAGERADRMQP